jgi:MFS family permease
LRSRLGALSQPDFRRLWIGQTVSAAGDGLTGVALTFAVLAISASATDLGIVFAAFLIPRVAFLLVGGVSADRLPRRSVMIASDLIRAGAQLMIGVAIVIGTHELWPLVVSAAISGGASAFFTPAAVGLIPQTISADRLQDANGLLGVSQWAARLGGPVVAGLAVAGGVLAPLFIIDAATFALSAVALARLTVGKVGAATHASFVDDFRDGWRQVTARRWLVISLGAFALANLGFSGLFILGPLIVGATPSGATDWGVLISVFALGGLVGAALAMRVRPARPLSAAFLIWLGMPVMLVLLSVSPPLVVLTAGAFVASLCTTLTDTIWHTTLQQQIPSEHLSRVSSVDWTISMVISPLGNLAVGPLALLGGNQAALVVLALVAGVPLLLVSFAPSVRAIRQSLEAANEAAEPVSVHDGVLGPEAVGV